MVNQGYAEKVPTLERHDGKVWYIPHHGVYHPRKDKLRVVFDCGAEFKGTSLYYQLLQGPNLTSSVIGVLLRFRQEPVAFMTDVWAMFYQVRVTDEDKDFLGFLWRPDGDVTPDIIELRMTVHLVSSPSCACFAPRKTAEDNQHNLQVESPEGVTEGDAVHLTCKSSCTLTDRATFIWYRNSQPLPERRDRNNQLLLQSVRREDAGRYSCAPHIMYSPKETFVAVSPCFDIVEGDSVTMICSSDANPPLKINWFKGGTFVGSGRIYSISKIRSDHSGEYKCKSINEHGEKYSDAVTLNIMYPPKNISLFINSSGEIVEGDSVSLICSSDSDPPGEISCFKGGTFVGSGRIYNISKIRSDHSGEYKCKSRNQHGEKYSDAVTLNVMYPPRNISVSISPSDEIVEGDSVTLICSSDSNPPALNFSWFKENQKSAVGSGQGFSALQSGRFYCEVHNQHGSQRSDAVTVTGQFMQHQPSQTYKFYKNITITQP
ncbi:B-cell receptor CD22-like [Onychostoma macrolepis]|uniref:B-cell receptor CD22-like n=1 Tax=Onychostoma macrolepis TaxID=369639 RepID=UPI00272A921F|nr:B-cell receptor CD22-like [Onychostoma macrolepis]